MKCRFSGCRDGKKIKIPDTFLIFQQSINFSNYLIGGNMLSSRTGQLWRSVDFAIYTIKIAGFWRQKVNALRKSQSSRKNWAK
jgi:hypothetical protein